MFKCYTKSSERLRGFNDLSNPSDQGGSAPTQEKALKDYAKLIITQ